MTKTTFKFYSDSGHGWIAVKIAYLKELGISENISTFSYVKGETAYLEEDRDAGIFFNAYEALHGVKPSYNEAVTKNGRSAIRSYSPYKTTGPLKGPLVTF